MTSPTSISPNSSWQAVIGLEVHVQLNTRSKIFSPAATAYGAEPNAQACAVSLALPGTLPVMNLEAARLAVKFGLAINAQINPRSQFARKHYFYPDLPKGYQISQYQHPIIGRGSLTIPTESGEKTIRITRAHLEEDAGKSLHQDFHGMSGIDLNRAGTPLLEIVSEPDMHTAAEAVAYLKRLHALVRHLQISDGNMQEGSFRCDANVSVRPAAQTQLGTRTELKNINSFRFVEKAINYEIARHIQILQDGGKITQQTRLYDETHDQTRAMRSKEDDQDYRYFPDPDLPPLILDDRFIAEVKAEMPDLQDLQAPPEARAEKFATRHNLPPQDAAKLLIDPALTAYFEATRTAMPAPADPKTIANWLLGDLTAALNKHNLPITQAPIPPEKLAHLLTRIADNTITTNLAKKIFQTLWQTPDQQVDTIIKSQNLTQITDPTALTTLIDTILRDHPDQVAQYHSGTTKVLGYLIGKAMQATSGKANPQQLNQLFLDRLKSKKC